MCQKNFELSVTFLLLAVARSERDADRLNLREAEVRLIIRLDRFASGYYQCFCFAALAINAEAILSPGGKSSTVCSSAESSIRRFLCRFRNSFLK